MEKSTTRPNKAVHERWMPLCGNNDRILTLQCKFDGGPDCLGFSDDNITFDFYNIKTGKRVVSFNGMKGRHTYKVIVSPNNGRVIASLHGCQVFVWNAQKRSRMGALNHGSQWHNVLDHGTRWVNDALFSSTGELLITSTQWEVRVWNISTMYSELILQRAHRDMSIGSQISLSADDQILASTTGDTVIYWDFPDCKNRTTVLTFPSKITCICFSPIVGSKTLACGSDNGFIFLKDISQKEIEFDFCSNMAHAKSITSLSFSRDGGLLASSARGENVCVWDPKKNTCLHLFSPFRDIVNIAFLPSGDQLAASSKTDYFVWTICEWSDYKNHLFGHKLKSVIYVLMCVKTYFIMHPSCDLPQLSMQLWLNIFHSLAQFSSYDEMSIEKY